MKDSTYTDLYEICKKFKSENPTEDYLHLETMGDMPTISIQIYSGCTQGNVGYWDYMSNPEGSFNPTINILFNNIESDDEVGIVRVDRHTLCADYDHIRYIPASTPLSAPQPDIRHMIAIRLIRLCKPEEAEIEKENASQSSGHILASLVGYV